MRWSYHEISDKQFDGFVAALRESRKPKPRWGVLTTQDPSGRLFHLSFDGASLAIASLNPTAIHEIARLLNWEAVRAGGEDR